MEGIMNMEKTIRKNIKKGINRIEKKQVFLQEGYQSAIYMEIYGTVIELNMVENTSAVELYIKAAARMNIDSSSLSIEICRIGKYIEGIGHI
jgi:hypothetical protein